MAHAAGLAVGDDDDAVVQEPVEHGRVPRLRASYVGDVTTQDFSGYRLIAFGGNAEDVVLMRAFADRPGGFFVDVGAGEPVGGSLTKNLVDRLGWGGVNIEPLPERYERLRAARPNGVTLRVAVGAAAGPATFFRVVPGPGMTGGGGGYSSIAIIVGRSAKRALASRLRMALPVCAACAAMIKSCAPRGVPVRRAWAIRRA